MRKLLLLIFIAVGSLLSSGQSAQGRYASRMTADGTLFFINPHKLGDLTNIRRFEYDMTLLTWTDSVTVNFTFESDMMEVPSSLKITSGDKSYVCHDYKSLFIDIKKKHYEIRISSQFAVADIIKIIDSTAPPAFVFTQNNITERAAYKAGAWRKDRRKLSDIVKLYLNSKK